MFNKFPFHRILVLFTLFSMSLTACNAAPTLTAPELTPAPDFTPTPRPTEIPTATPEPTNTPDPLAGAPEGATGKDSKGNYIKTVEENGHTYEYVYNAELGQNVREVANFPLMDTPIHNYIPFKIFITDNTLNERNLLSISHVDWINNGEKTTPLTSTFKPKLEQRYFGLGNLENASGDQQIWLQTEMRKGLDSQAFVPIILSNGEKAQWRLSTETGIILTIMDKETLFKLGGENVSTWHDGYVTFYVDVYGVDERGTMLSRIAFDFDSEKFKSLSDIPGKTLRKVIFMVPGNLVDHEDQGEQGFSFKVQSLVQYSEELRGDGTQDVEIKRVTASSETPTPTPTP